MLPWLALCRLAGRFLWRDLRSGALTVLALSVLLSVTALTAVLFLALRLEAVLERDAKAMLGGDAVLVSDTPLPAVFRAEAERLGLRTCATLAFPSMVQPVTAAGAAVSAAASNAAPRLVALKAVGDCYPLRGRLEVSGGTGALPGPGQVWVDPGLLHVLGLELGASVRLGQKQFVLAGLLQREPDRGLGFSSFAPRVLMRQDDMAETGLVQPASRIGYRLMVATKEDTPPVFGQTASVVATFVAWAKQRAEKDQVHGLRIDALENGRPEYQETLGRAQHFLALVAMLSALLSAIALTLSSHQFARQRVTQCAMLRVLGLSQAKMNGLFLLELLGLAALSALLGVALGYALHGVMLRLLTAFFISTGSPLAGQVLPAPGWRPVWAGLLLGISQVAGCAMPVILRLSQVPALAALRQDVRLRSTAPANFAAAGAVLLALAGLVFLFSMLGGGAGLSLAVLGGFVLSLLCFAALSWGLLSLFLSVILHPRWRGWPGLAWSMAAKQMRRYRWHTVLQTSTLAAGLTVLLVFYLLQNDFVAAWQRATPAQAPNRFAINILPEQEAEVKAQLAEAKVAPDYDWYPMLRGRLIAINGRAVGPEQYSQDRAKRLLDREFNLSYRATLPSHNKLAAGQWTAGDARSISMEEGVAKTLGIGLGDVLRFDIAGVERESRVTSLRQVQWSSMRANFFALYPVDDLAPVAELPYTFMAAFRAPEGSQASGNLDAALLRGFPNLTLVDTSAALAQIQDVLGTVMRVLQLLFVFSLLAGLVVLVATLQSSLLDRSRDAALLRTLGAGNALLSAMQNRTLLLLGLFAGLLAASAAALICLALAYFVLDFAYVPQPLLWPVAAALGAFLAWAVGWWVLRPVLRTPALATLREQIG